MIAAAFDTGRWYLSRGAAQLFVTQAGPQIIQRCLERHVSGDCGDMCEEDQQANARAIEHGEERVFSSYETSLGKIWIITEADCSSTTVLLPEEY